MKPAIIESESENNLLLDIVKGSVTDGPMGESFWIGGYDLYHEGRWNWITNGKVFTYSNWNAHEPNNKEVRPGVNQHCARVLLKND